MFSWFRERRRTIAIAKETASAIYRNVPEVKVSGVYKSANSIRFHISPGGARGDELLIKMSRPYAVQGHLETGILSLPSVSRRLMDGFRVAAPPWLQVPEIVQADDSLGILVMKYVNGTNLKLLLSRSRPQLGFESERIAELCGRALATWHSCERTPGRASFGHDRSGYSNTVLSYLDYSVWNIRVRPDMKSLALLDFPGAEIQADRQRDLASFLHSLLVVRHHPFNMLKGLTWWDWRSIYSAFLSGYVVQSGLPLETADFHRITDNLQSAIRKMAEQYARLSENPRMALERYWYSRLGNHPALRPETLVDAFTDFNRRSG